MSQEQHEVIKTNGNHSQESPNPEVLPKAERRQYSAEYKSRILKEADACREIGQIGALLRREGLYSSHLTTWRRQRERGELEGLSGQVRGPKGGNGQEKEMVQLRRENEQLRQRLERAEIVIEVQKKLSQLLGIS